jgi:hypothetical protein
MKPIHITFENFLYKVKKWDLKDISDTMYEYDLKLHKFKEKYRNNDTSKYTLSFKLYILATFSLHIVVKINVYTRVWD